MHGEQYPLKRTTESSVLDAITEELYVGKQAIHPVSFTMAPDTDHSAFLCSGGSSSYFMQPIDRDKRADLKSHYEGMRTRLEAVDVPMTDVEYSQSTQLRWELNMRLGLLANTDYFRPIDGSAWSSLPKFMEDASGEGRHSMHSEEDFEHAANRINGFTEWAVTAMDNMDDGIRKGETMARVLGERAIRVMTGHLTDNARSLRDAFTRPLDHADIGGVQRKEYENLIDTVVVPTYSQLRQYMQFEYMPYCKENDQLGLFYMNNGPEQYQRLTRYHASDSVSVEQLAAVAEQDYHESLHTLDKLARKLGFDSAGAITQFLLNDTTPHEQVRPFTDVQQVVDGYMDFAGRVDRGLPRIFFEEDMPNDRWRLLPVTDHTASMTPATNTNGTFRAPIPEVTRYVAPRIAKLFHHEVNPGHHAQNSIYEQLALPDFLRYSAYYPGVHEGWAMYAETLASEIETPYSDWELAARLCSKVSTAALAMIDIGMHYEGWNLDMARQRAQELIPGYDISQEALFLLRNAEWPAQVHAYVYGERAMRDIRQAVETHIKRPVDIRLFHHLWLRAGQQPLALLRQETMFDLIEHLYDDI